MNETKEFNSWPRTVFEKTVNILNRERISFCLLRNYEEYPEKFSGDIDILVSREALPYLDRLVAEIAADLGGRVWNYYSEKDDVRLPRMIFRFKEEVLEVVHLDFIFKVEEFGIEFLDPDRALAARRPFKDFFILGEEDEFFHIFLRAIFSRTAQYQKRYSDRIRIYLNQGRFFPTRLVSGFFPAPVVVFIRRCFQNGKLEIVFSHPSFFKFLFLAKSGDIFRRILPLFFRFFRKVFRIFRPTGKFVVIIGPDGVGKSTTAILANQLMNEAGFSAFHCHLGFRPTILPHRSESKGGNDAGFDRNVFWDFFRYCYHFLDYWLSYYFQIRSRLVDGQVVIAERYFFDYVISPSRKIPGVNQSFIRWTFYFLMPKPTICILLANDPDEIFKRRPELTKQEIVEYLERGREFGKVASKFFEIRTDKSPVIVAEELVRLIIAGE